MSLWLQQAYFEHGLNEITYGTSVVEEGIIVNNVFRFEIGHTRTVVSKAQRHLLIDKTTRTVSPEIAPKKITLHRFVVPQGDDKAMLRTAEAIKELVRLNRHKPTVWRHIRKLVCKGIRERDKDKAWEKFKEASEYFKPTYKPLLVASAPLIRGIAAPNNQFLPKTIVRRPKRPL